ncbi:MAG: fibronectin type III domain-containing protein [Ignavibacteriales bacterium]|nr:fibronectin type III domain-containing protein [Ignavibacteriales bacterium]
MKKRFLLSTVFISILLITGCATKSITKEEKALEKKEENIKTKLSFPELAASFREVVKKKQFTIPLPPLAKVDTVISDETNKSIQINFNREFSNLPFRQENVEQIYSSIKDFFGVDYSDYKFSIQTLHKPIEQLIPNYFRKDKSEFDLSRLPSKTFDRPSPVVQNISKPFKIDKGLFQRNIVLWNSHGWYYSSDEDRWEWQRPRLFQTVEDLIPTSFVLPYILPMLENAGANIFMPRERDTQTNEAVVDNDVNELKAGNEKYLEANVDKNHHFKTSEQAGFAVGNPPYPEGYNPFKKGTARFVQADSKSTALVNWIPDIPETGYYAVYISYPASDKNISDAHYSVYHEGGITDFVVNQKIGGSTWIYLGKFKFGNGYNPTTGKVLLSNMTGENPEGKIVSADAVRFGGGMGIISRNGSTSGRPKYVESARYNLQYSGMPDTLVYSFMKDKDDYRDDYQCRAEYANYLNGAPSGPNKNRNEKGLGIPIDLTMAFHTDAGITHNDTTIGTLSIYTIEDNDKKDVFPSGYSRFANRDLADLVQTQICDDIKAKFDPAWSRRQLREADYSESRRPNIPSVLLELLSHQNFLDMKYVLDPRFRFTVSRAIYKAMLRFISTQNGTDYVVQPLPVDHFQAILDNNSGVELKWQPVDDPLKPTAKAVKYVLYTRMDDNDFDNGILVEGNSFKLPNLKPGKIYSFKVTAVNEGGESFPSEILSVCWMNNKKDPVLIVNGFDRICGPATVDTKEFSGFTNFVDAGVPDKYDFNFTGTQYNFDPVSDFRTNDAPGHGASYAYNEGLIFAGNSFDYPFIHGNSIKSCGYSYSSASGEAVWDNFVDLTKYKFIDLILGKEKETHWQKAIVDSLNGTQFVAFPVKLQAALTNFTKAGGNLFVSGSYIGTDLFKPKGKDSTDIKFAHDILKFNWISDHAAKIGKVVSTSNSFIVKNMTFLFNTELTKDIYHVDAPDAIGPFGGSKTILRYFENKFSAATFYKNDYGVVVFGFPFETIQSEEIRDIVMKNIFDLLKM